MKNPPTSAARTSPALKTMPDLAGAGAVEPGVATSFAGGDPGEGAADCDFEPAAGAWEEPGEGERTCGDGDRSADGLDWGLGGDNLIVIFGSLIAF
jgi:hypothetical protein